MIHPISATLINWQEAHDAALARREQLRCCAPGCGDQIKEWCADQQVYRIVWSDESISYLEDDSCVDWFVNGHPDYGQPRGSVVGLPGCEVTLIDASADAKRRMGALDTDSQQAIASLIMGRMSLL